MITDLNGWTSMICMQSMILKIKKGEQKYV